jgi:hypothetical protein
MKKVILSFTVLLVLLCACSSSTRLISSWKSPKAPSDAMKKVLVIAVGNYKSFNLQQSLEQAVVNELSRFNVEAVSAFTQFGPDGLITGTEQDIVKQIDGAGYTSVMLLSLVHKSQDTTYIPPRITTRKVVHPTFHRTMHPFVVYRRHPAFSPFFYPVFPPFYHRFHHPFYRSFMYTHHTVFTPGYYDVTTTIILQAEVFAMSTGERIYFGQTLTTDPSSTQALAADFSSVIADNMASKRLLPRRANRR